MANMSNIDRFRQTFQDVENRKQRELVNRQNQQRIDQDLEKAEIRRETSLQLAEMRRQIYDANAEIKRNNDEWRHLKETIQLEIKTADSETRRQALETRLEIAKQAVEQRDRALQQKADEFKSALEEKQFQFDNAVKKEGNRPRNSIKRIPKGGGLGEEETIYEGTPEYAKILQDRAATQAAETAAAAQAEAVKRENERLGMLGRIGRFFNGAQTPPPMPATNLPSIRSVPNSMLPPPMIAPTIATGTNSGSALIVPTAEGEWDLEGGMRAPAMMPSTNTVPSAVAPQFIVPPMSDTTNAPAAPSRKLRVRGPGGRTGTVPEGAALPEGWSFE